jgi:bifunctional DNA-binding transcriptional regulator/antitoxin component of YhaV-PrlF toxin-antitoxin module
MSEELKQEMTSVLIGPDGNLTIPTEIRHKYQMEPATPVRIVETSSGILVIPITDSPMSEELQSELAEWQSLSLETWDMFPYEEEAA